MGSLLAKKKLKISTPIFLLILLVFSPSLILSAGFQEEKLFDGDFYSSEDLTRKIENHNREIQVINKQIKALETNIDWLVLKINQIQDSDRTAGVNLKKSITSKEKKINTLLKSKNRLKDLVQYYSSKLDPERQKISSFKKKRAFSEQKKAKLEIKNIVPKKSITKPKHKSNPNDSITKTQLQNAVNKAGLGDWVEINGSQTCLRIETTLPILFPTGSARVASEYKSFFQKLARFLKPYDVKVLVNGYADIVPIHNKKYPSNFELGAARAANIVHQLVTNGMKPSIFKIESTGKYRFAAKGMSKQKTLERRAEVTVIFSG